MKEAVTAEQCAFGSRQKAMNHSIATARFATRPRSHPDGWDVNVRCLDGDARERFQMRAFDGQNWESKVGEIL
jgi:hypothetical protein